MRLLKFRSLSKAKIPGKTSPYERVLDLLDNSHLWAADPYSFNDPFDSNLPFDTKHTPTAKFLKDSIKIRLESNDFRDSTLQYNVALKSDKALRNFFGDWVERRKWHSRFYVNLGVISFSKKIALKNPLLWAHYANSHDGICFEFEFSENPNNREMAINKIKYLDKMEPFKMNYPNNFYLLDSTKMG